jgi:hypothetical protein
MNRNPDQATDKNLTHLPADTQRARVENARNLEDDATQSGRGANELVEQYLERPRKRRSTRAGAPKHPQG